MKKLSTAALNIDGQPMFKYLDRARKLEAEGRSMIHMEIGDPDFSTPQNIVMAAVKSLCDGKTHYTSSWGDLEFRETIRTATYKSRGFLPDLNQVLVVPGANVGIFYAVFTLCDPGEEVLVPDPGFATYYSSIKMCGVNAVRVPLKEEHGFRMQAADVLERITDKTRLLILNSPNNPTGAVMTKDELKAIYDLCVEKDIYLYSDEIYSRMIYDDYEFTSPAQYDQCRTHVILSNGFSKAFAMTGWRLGALIGPPDVMERMSALLQTTSSCVSSFIQSAGTEAIRGSQDAVYNMMHEYEQRRNILVEGLNDVKGFTCQMPGGAFYVFPNITGTGLTDTEVCEQLMDKAGVVTVPGSCFGEHGAGHIRLCYATDRDSIKSAIKRIKQWADKL
jgi:aspartate/methionine/tyrosine aminotransferase